MITLLVVTLWLLWVPDLAELLLIPLWLLVVSGFVETVVGVVVESFESLVVIAELPVAGFSSLPLAAAVVLCWAEGGTALEVLGVVGVLPLVSNAVTLLSVDGGTVLCLTVL